MFQIQTVVEKFAIPRYEGWEEILEPLVRKITGAQQGKVRTGVDYQNNVFKMKMHRFGICHCSYGKQYREFVENNGHALECFHTAWQEIQDAFKNHPKYHDALILKTERINMETQLCRKFRVPYRGGVYIANVCTCDFKRKWEALGIEHDEDCEHVAPNFWHTESDLKIWWVKKFFRESYSNKRVDTQEFKSIIKECLKSV
jgi:hypothetical protein